MKKLLLSLAFALALAAPALAQDAATPGDSLGLPGDNLDLAGVLDLFKQSSSPEDFEKKLNDPASQVNNLDLDENNEVDYIRVVDKTEGDVHAFVLQVPVSETESQDVAVVELEKTGAEAADLQVVGDEELYGEDYIVEAKDEAAAKETGSKEFRPAGVVVNVWLWPCVRFVYAPAYVVWVSPWRWHYYPVWWKPWRPVAWRVHHARVVRYHAHYHCVHHHRVMRAHGVYRPHRVHSATVHRRYEAAHQRHAARHTPAKAGNAQHKSGGHQQKGGAQHKANGQQHKGGGHQQKGGKKASGNAPKGGKGGGGQKHGGAPKGGRR